jgi:hypothetical protein
VSGFLGALASAASPLLIGAIADRFPIEVGGDTEGNLAIAFAFVTPLILIGAIVVLNGRRYVERDIANVAALEHFLETGEDNRLPLAPAERGPIPVALLIKLAVYGLAFIWTTWTLVIAFDGGKLPGLPWHLDGGLETGIVWALCAYPLVFFIASRLVRLLVRVFARANGDAETRV